MLSYETLEWRLIKYNEHVVQGHEHILHIQIIELNTLFVSNMFITNPCQNNKYNVYLLIIRPIINWRICKTNTHRDVSLSVLFIFI